MLAKNGYLARPLRYARENGYLARPLRYARENGYLARRLARCLQDRRSLLQASCKISVLKISKKTAEKI